MAVTTSWNTITATSVWSAMETPGGVTREFMDLVEAKGLKSARRLAPVNNPMNAMHRGGRVGVYKASLRTDHRGTRRLILVRRLMATAPHADIVEFGRPAVGRLSASWDFDPGYTAGTHQRFSWTGWGGQIRSTRYTSGRPGEHVLERALGYGLANAIRSPRMPGSRRTLRVPEAMRPVRRAL